MTDLLLSLELERQMLERLKKRLQGMVVAEIEKSRYAINKRALHQAKLIEKKIEEVDSRLKEVNELLEAITNRFLKIDVEV